MSRIHFSQLLAWELQRVRRSPLLWSILAGLAVTFLWATLTTASMHREQTAAQAAALESERAWMKDIRRRVDEYDVRADTPLPYWQDPTDAGGFSQYFLRKHSLKPHLPLSPLAAGASDLLPGRLQVKLATPFGIDDTYDFENPRALALGQFDLAFAIVYLLPIALILLLGLLITFERDHGVMRLVAAQPITPRLWLNARVTAILLIVQPFVCVAVVIALVVAGVDVTQAPVELMTALLLTSAYGVLWVAIICLVLSGWPRASGAIASSAVIWALLLIGVPLAANTFLSWWHPATPAAEYVNDLRNINDAVQGQGDDIVAAAFRSTPALAGHLDAVKDIDHATRLTFLIPEIERRSAALRAALLDAHFTQERASTLVGFISPPLSVETAFTRLAGTDLARHRDFEAQTREYQLELRRILYRVMHAEIATPTPRPFPDSYGRFNFTDYDVIPEFRMRDAAPSARARGTLSTILWLCFVAAILTAMAARRLRRWPAEL